MSPCTEQESNKAQCFKTQSIYFMFLLKGKILRRKNGHTSFKIKMVRSNGWKCVNEERVYM